MTNTIPSAGHSARSLRGLDGLNVPVADVRGSYLAVFFKGSQRWQAADVGVAMAASSVAASSVAAALLQIPAGALVDGTRARRLLVALCSLAVAAGCLLIAFAPRFGTVIAAQVLVGAASAIIPPALASISLGLVGRRRSTAASAATRASTTAATSPRPWSR